MGATRASSGFVRVDRPARWALTIPEGVGLVVLMAAAALVPALPSLAIERELQQQLFQSADAKEGLAAYVEKRAAEFTGS